ncbi:hypothetical protein B0J11DRAFT_440587 [Dendryphion nanum]|uniref:Mit domain-containing protein n=1 Tax=Dendryphion nanum TaxID=256645 RepID=A0A9P9DGQ7_9PLEO|nr:hypothetical protein B0J11DRAFT_440587 [Dendryphion nanum]
MNLYSTHAAPPSQPLDLPLSARRPSSASVNSLHRSASLRDSDQSSSSRPRRPASPPSSRRRSSAAGFAVDGIAIAPSAAATNTHRVNRWSHSTSGSAKSPPQHNQNISLHPLDDLDASSTAPAAAAAAAATTSRNLTITNAPTLASLNGASPSSPVRKPQNFFSDRSPASSPSRRPRPRSPVFNPSAAPLLTSPPPTLPSLPLLPSTVYDPSTPNTTSSNNSPSTAGLFHPNTYSPNSSTDYFNAKPRAPSQNAQRPPSRNKADRILGRSPLGSPPIGLLESEARHAKSSSVSSRPTTANRPPTAVAAPARESAHKPTHSTGHERSRSHQQDPRSRSESNASTRLDDSHQGTPPRHRERREKDKKTMLSRALQKANTAVLLDNAQNFEGAMEATPGYNSSTGKSLPARPMSNESLDEHRSMLLDAADDDDEEPVIQTASMTRIINDRPFDDRPPSLDPEPPQPQFLPLRNPHAGGMRESVISSAIRDMQRGMPAASPFHLQPPPGKLGTPPPLGTPGLESPMDRSYMPPPLSPKRTSSPLHSSKHDSDTYAPNSFLQPEHPRQPTHQRGNSSESTSWLDTIDESGGSSCSSSIHSLSPGGARRKHIRNASGNTEAEFDAALDAAVEAAYDEGYEPFEEDDMPTSAELIATRLRNVELAKEHVREAEREDIISSAKYRYRESQIKNESLPHVRKSAEFNLLSDEADEEERLLDEITREYMLDGFDFDLQTKSSLPRQSDSSNFSGSTYHSSVSSHRTTGGTSLSTVAEIMYPPRQKAPTHSPPPLPTASGALPSVSEVPPPPASNAKEASVRNRRLSSQNAKSLKIETSLPPVPPAPHTEKLSVTEKEALHDVPPMPKSAAATVFSSTQNSIDLAFKVPALPADSRQQGLMAPSPLPYVPSPADTTFTVSPATPAVSHAMSNDISLAPSSPKTGKNSALGIRKNKSSLSLKQRTLSISSPDGSDASMGTPLSTTFSFTNGRKQSAAVPGPTPSVPTFNVDGLPSGGMHLFESDIHSPYSPGSPSGAVANAPIPLEPCPDSYLLRPFWLMRCFYQTIAHPRGGYLSTKLFVPRDVWRVKGVKLKNLDDKISNCDLLTAALQRLGSVDTLDADAVLEEVQALELVLDQVQTVLAKRLGNEVGSQGTSALFKDAHTVGNGSAGGDNSDKGSHSFQDHVPKSAVSQGKSYLNTWRKLRSKGSAVGLSNMAGAKSTLISEVPKDSLTMATLPMTSLPNIRFAKRDVSSLTFEGPNSAYMSSLARLFDAAQILDQIARQVEDPGLKHSSPTHIGLELSARHAAEFFGFYICRFVLTDITLMLDKFIKRGSEWVLV